MVTAVGLWEAFDKLLLYLPIFASGIETATIKPYNHGMASVARAFFNESSKIEKKRNAQRHEVQILSGDFSDHFLWASNILRVSLC